MSAEAWEAQQQESAGSELEAEDDPEDGSSDISISRRTPVPVESGDGDSSAAEEHIDMVEHATVGPVQPQVLPDSASFEVGAKPDFLASNAAASDSRQRRSLQGHFSPAEIKSAVFSAEANHSRAIARKHWVLYADSSRRVVPLPMMMDIAGIPDYLRDL